MKDKETRLEDEQQERRQQRAEEAVRRLEEVGKQTLLMLAPKRTRGGKPIELDLGLRPGRLSRVLFEAAIEQPEQPGADQLEQRDRRDQAQQNGRQPKPRDRDGKPNPEDAGTRNHAKRALEGIDDAVATIQNAARDVTGAGLRDGLEAASRQVSEIVQRLTGMTAPMGAMLANPTAAFADLLEQETQDEREAKTGGARDRRRSREGDRDDRDERDERDQSDREEQETEQQASTSGSDATEGQAPAQPREGELSDQQRPDVQRRGARMLRGLRASLLQRKGTLESRRDGVAAMLSLRPDRERNDSPERNERSDRDDRNERNERNNDRIVQPEPNGQDRAASPDNRREALRRAGEERRPTEATRPTPPNERIQGAVGQLVDQARAAEASARAMAEQTRAKAMAAAKTAVGKVAQPPAAKQPGKQDKQDKQGKQDKQDKQDKRVDAKDSGREKPTGKPARDAAPDAKKPTANPAANVAANVAANRPGGAAATALPPPGTSRGEDRGATNRPADQGAARRRGEPQDDRPARPQADPRTRFQPSDPSPQARAAAPVNVARGEIQISPQPIETAPSREVQQSEQSISQPSFQISANATTANLPEFPKDLSSQTAPKIEDGPAATANQQPAAAAPQPARAPRKVEDLPPAAPRAQDATPRRKVTAKLGLPPMGKQQQAAGNQGARTRTAASTRGNAGDVGAVRTAAKEAKVQPEKRAVTPKVAPTPTAATTPAPNLPKQSIPKVTNPGGSGPPNPGGLVPKTVSLDPDRSAARSSIASEAATQQRVPPSAQQQEAQQIKPLGPMFERTAADATPRRTGAYTRSQQDARTQAARDRQRNRQAAQDAKQQIASQARSAAAERARAKAAPPPAILKQTSPTAMKTAAAPVRAEVANATKAAMATPVKLSANATHRAARAAGTNSTLPAFDERRFAEIDRRPPMPDLDTAAIDGAQQRSAATYQQADHHTEQLANIPTPKINVPARDTSGKTKSGQPTRDAAIAKIEQEVAKRAESDAPAKMREAATPVQAELRGKAQTSRQSADQSAGNEITRGKGRAQELKNAPAPVTGAQVAAQVRPEYEGHQAEATAASQQMRGQIATAKGAAETQTRAAKGRRDQKAASARQQYDHTVNSELMPQYAQAQQQANAQFQQQDQAAQQVQQQQQQQAETAAQQQTEKARAKNEADCQAEEAKHQQQQDAARQSHDEKSRQAEEQHEKQKQKAQSDMEADVKQRETEMKNEVKREEEKGKQEVEKHHKQGEQDYQAEIAKGEAKANAEKQKAEAAAEAKKQEAESKKGGGGIFGKIAGAVKGAINGLLDAAKAILDAARDLVVKIMETARQAAQAALEKCRQAALAALEKVKSVVQGIITAAAAAVRGIISAAASLVRTIIQNLATALQAIVQALEQVLTKLLEVLQKVVNGLLDALIAAVSLINEDLGNKLREATQKYRDAFNKAVDGLQEKIKQASNALQAKIQQVADQAIAVVDAAERALHQAVDAVERTLHAAVETAYNIGKAAINKAFDAASAAIDVAFDAAIATVNKFVDAQLAAISKVQEAVTKVAEFVTEIADKVLEAVASVAEALVDMIPEAWTKAFVDFWTGPWRNIIIIGLATVAAVAITVATLGTGAPLAAILMAGVIGGTMSGAAYFGGELVAREGQIHLSEQGKGMYIPGFGYAQLGPDGKPVPPPGMSPDDLADFEKQSAWAASNFEVKRDAQGNVIGYERRSGSEIANHAVIEGINGFGQGAISSAAAMGAAVLGPAALATSWGSRFTGPLAQTMIKSGAAALTSVAGSTFTSAWDAGFGALRSGASPGKAFLAALTAGGQKVTSPTTWLTAAATMGLAKFKVDKLIKKSGGTYTLPAVTSRTIIQETAKGQGIKIATAPAKALGTHLSKAGKDFVRGYSDAIRDGKSPEEALEAAKKAADGGFDVDRLVRVLRRNSIGGGTPPR